MKAIVGPVMIGEYGEWDMGDGPITNKQGEVVEFVKVIDLDGEDVSRYTMRQVPQNGRPKPMSMVMLEGDLESVSKARRAGTDTIVVDVLKFSITGFSEYTSPASPAERAKEPAGQRS